MCATPIHRPDPITWTPGHVPGLKSGSHLAYYDHCQRKNTLWLIHKIETGSQSIFPSNGRNTPGAIPPSRIAPVRELFNLFVLPHSPRGAGQALHIYDSEDDTGTFTDTLYAPFGDGPSDTSFLRVVSLTCDVQQAPPVPQPTPPPPSTDESSVRKSRPQAFLA